MKFNLFVLVVAFIGFGAACVSGVEWSWALFVTCSAASVVYCLGRYSIGKEIAEKEHAEYLRLVENKEPGDALSDAIVKAVKAELGTTKDLQWERFENARRAYKVQTVARAVFAGLVISGGWLILEQANAGYKDIVCHRYDDDWNCAWNSNYEARQAAIVHVEGREYFAARRANEVYGATTDPHDQTALAAWYFEKVGCYGREAYLSAPLLEKHRVVFDDCKFWVRP